MEGIQNKIDFDNSKEQETLLSSEAAWLKQSLRDNDLTHPALVRLKGKLDKPSDILSKYSKTYSRSCFPAGSDVLLADMTTKVIEQISVGDIIMGFDGTKPVPTNVEALESPLRDHHCILSFADGSTLKLTQEHPLYTKDGWKSLSPESTAEENKELLVGKLEIGDRILTITGSYQILIDIIFVPGQVQTYNIKKLSQHDNFFVNGFLAHTKAQLSLCGKCAPRFADFWCRVDNSGCRATNLNEIVKSEKVDTYDVADEVLPLTIATL